MLGKLAKLVVVLVVFGAIGIAGYALLGDLSPAPSENTQTVTLGDG